MSQHISSIERATLDAVPPQQLQTVPGWLLAMDSGTVGRAHSATPLSHGLPKPGVDDLIEALYTVEGFQAVFRVPRVESFDGFRTSLAQKDYVSSKPTLTQIGTVSGMAMLGELKTAVPVGDAQITQTPGDAWTKIFLGEGFDPADGASRLEILRRAKDSVFASVAVDGEIAAVGSACFSGGWAGVNGMRTAPAWRGKGLASRILGVLARQARQHGIARAFLQGEEKNKGAQSLYRRAGFETAWSCEYWRLK